MLPGLVIIYSYLLESFPESKTSKVLMRKNFEMFVALEAATKMFTFLARFNSFIKYEIYINGELQDRRLRLIRPPQANNLLRALKIMLQ